MLKIRDNVDLKELEKFGFVKVAMHKEYKNKRYYSNPKNGAYIIVDDEHYGSKYYKILGSRDWKENNNLHILYDLIQAGLVEKIDNKEEV